MGKRDDLIYIGGTKELENRDRYPSIYELIHRPMEPEVKEKVLRYMKRSEHIAVALMTARDILDPGRSRICDLTLMSDGKYEWRSDTIYYVEKYDLELPQEFIEHVLAKKK